jgi:chromosome segregation ATPase
VWPGRNWPWGPLGHAGSNSDLFDGRAVETRGRSTCLSPTNTAGIIGLMSDVVPITAWMTYQQVAERLGLRSTSAAASRARRGKWPRRTRNDTLETEVCVPPEVLAAGPQKPRERRVPAGPAAAAISVGDAVAAGIAPLQAVIERLSAELAATRAGNEALRDQLAATQSEAAELRGRSAANEAALEREVADRRAVQQQADHSRREHQAAQERVAQAQVSLREQQARLQTTEDLVMRLKRELHEAQRGKDGRRWWQWR